MKQIVTLILIAVASVGALAMSATSLLALAPQDAKNIPAMLPRAQEVALAETAGPAHIAKDAAIYALEKDGYVLAREGTNGFTCLVLRSFPGAQEPECYDSEGTATLLPLRLDEARYRAEGLSREQVNAKIAAGFESGKYRAPRRPGIVYMLSCENHVPIDDTGSRIIHYQPHFMFYSPYLTDADIGGGSQDRWMPFVIAAGGPGAMIIVPAGEDSAAPRCPAGKD